MTWEGWRRRADHLCRCDARRISNSVSQGGGIDANLDPGTPPFAPALRPQGLHPEVAPEVRLLRLHVHQEVAVGEPPEGEVEPGEGDDQRRAGAEDERDRRDQRRPCRGSHLVILRYIYIYIYT